MKSGMTGRLLAGAAAAVLVSGVAWAAPVLPVLQLAKGGAASEARIWLASAEDGAPGDKMWRGDDKGEPASDETADDAEDGPVWAGGNPDFCEACGGVVEDEGETPEPVDVELGDPLDDSVTVDDDTMWAGGDPDFCEACGGVVVDDAEVMSMTAGVQQQHGGRSQMAGRAPGGERPTDRCGLAGVAYRCGDR